MLVPFDDDALAEARATNDRLATTLAGGAPPAEVDLDEARRLRSTGGGPFPGPVRLPQAEDRTVPGPAGDLTVRLLVPPDPVGACAFVHGGGFTTGAADQQDEPLWDLAVRTGLAVASVEHRLAPEDPHPAAVDDCEAALRWCIDWAEGELGSDRVAVSAESTGAHLALSALLRLRGDGLAGAVGALDLLYGIYDLSLTPSVRAPAERTVLLDRATVEWFVEAYTPGLTAEERRRPDVSPLYASLAGLPPTLVSVGLHDPLLDDSTFLAARLAAAGVAVELRTYPEAYHGFTTLGTRIGDAGRAGQAEFLLRALAIPDRAPTATTGAL
ncbi:MAG TPA: alpha/beta hydrolase fold domain-containing protein [Acidimicrobiales bacterium]|nr:alpha/beta hydrolase fold domain-containing protein [Acidimicrobiales bacterium]